MDLPPLLMLQSEVEYRKYFDENFVRGSSVLTFDGLVVKFHPADFDHAFFESMSRSVQDKAEFSWERAQRMNWVSSVLNDGTVELYRRKEKGKMRRLALRPQERYLVVVQISNKLPSMAYFYTAYVLNSESAFNKVRSNPHW